MRILHVLANGPPDVNGYAIRTAGLLRSQAKMEEIEPIALTSPWYPERETLITPLELDGVIHHRCLHPVHDPRATGIGQRWVAKRGQRRITGAAGFASRSLLSRAIQLVLKPIRPAASWMEERIQFRRFTRRIIEVAKAENADLIHAHVPHRVGLPALHAARILGCPFVYEMRGMWEESAVAGGRWRDGGLAHRRFRRLETKALKAADAVICISETLRQEAISRGVDPECITVVPNGVDSLQNQLESSPLFEKMRDKLEAKNIVGYIGSLRALEGVDLTAEAVSLLRNRGVDVDLFVLSTEPGQADLIDHCQHLGIAENAHIVGPVPHAQVPAFLDLIDVFVVSRPDVKVARLVTPLKPFEAMGAGLAVVLSDLPALAEIVEDGKTGCLSPPGDVGALADAIHGLLADPEERFRIGRNAREWVSLERSWDVVVAPTSAVYSNLLES
jgi:glycogen(starch) synthase